ncbi:MAG: tetratricopeptide repeat protein [Desulfobacterales bacterium]|nr:tetratricopeptide repeat protein [Desulfobacterales bacterium]
MLRKTTYLFLFFAILAATGHAANAEVKTVISSGQYNMGDRDSKADAKNIALLNAKRLALEQAGTYLKSLSEVRDFQLNKDEISSIAAGILSVNIIDEKWKMEGTNLTVTLTIEARIDTGSLDSRIKAVKQDNDRVEDFKQIQNELARLKAELDKLKAQEQQAATQEKHELARLRAELEKLKIQERQAAAQGKNEVTGLRAELEKLKTEEQQAAAREKKLAEDQEALDRQKHVTISRMVALESVEAAFNKIINSDDVAGALDELSGLISADPEYAIAYATRARAYIKLDRRREALADVEKALELNPDLPRAYVIKGILLLQEGNSGAALEQFARAIRIKSDCGPCYFQMGVAHFRDGDRREAYENFQKSCEFGFEKGCDRQQRMEENMRRRGRD